MSSVSVIIKAYGEVVLNDKCPLLSRGIAHLVVINKLSKKL